MPKYIITGGPGAGKTTLLEALQRRNYFCIAEVSRQLIMEESEKGSNCLPWTDLECFAGRALERMVADWQTADERAPCFYDRGIPDIIAYLTAAGLPITEPFKQASQRFRYAATIFILPPWERIYTPDPARWQTFEESQTIYRHIHSIYRSLGYELIELPEVTVEQRAALILKTLNL